MKVSETSTLKRLLIITVRFKNIKASLKFLQRLNNKNSMKQQWNIIYSEISRKKRKWSFFSHSTHPCSIKVPSKKHPQNITEASMKHQWVSEESTIKSKHFRSLKVKRKSSVFQERCFSKPSKKQQGIINVSEYSAIRAIMINNVCIKIIAVS